MSFGRISRWRGSGLSLPAVLWVGMGSLCAQNSPPAGYLGAAQQGATLAAGAQVGFRYVNSQLQPAKYTLVVDESGAGEFHSEPAANPPEDSASYHPLAGSLDRPVQLSKTAADQIFAAARAEKYFAIDCEDAKNKVAFQGTKELSYRGADGNGSCTYNWSKRVHIQKLTSLFESIAFTLEEGRRLDVEHKHDRLALDAELGVLLEAVKDGAASEVENIRPVLQAIIDDDATLERARARAQKLLEGRDGNRASLP